MPRSGPRAVRKYSDEFKLTAAQLSQRPGLRVKSVAAALTIHPFMLSKWRKDARDGRLGGRARKAPPPGPAREIAQLQHALRTYIRYYNATRLHSSLDYLSPLAFERRAA